MIWVLIGLHVFWAVLLLTVVVDRIEDNDAGGATTGVVIAAFSAWTVAVLWGFAA